MAGMTKAQMRKRLIESRGKIMRVLADARVLDVISKRDYTELNKMQLFLADMKRKLK